MDWKGKHLQTYVVSSADDVKSGCRLTSTYQNPLCSCFYLLIEHRGFTFDATSQAVKKNPLESIGYDVDVKQCATVRYSNLKKSTGLFSACPVMFRTGIDRGFNRPPKPRNNILCNRYRLMLKYFKPSFEDILYREKMLKQYIITRVLVLYSMLIYDHAVLDHSYNDSGQNCILIYYSDS